MGFVSSTFGLLPDALEHHHLAHLLHPRVPDQVRVLHPRDTAQITADKAPQQSRGTRDIGFLGNAPSALEKHEERMVTGDIVRAAVLDAIPPGAVGRTRKAIV